jgi:hypothetical protein
VRSRRGIEKLHNHLFVFHALGDQIEAVRFRQILDVLGDVLSQYAFHHCRPFGRTIALASVRCEAGLWMKLEEDLEPPRTTDDLRQQVLASSNRWLVGNAVV